MSNLIKSANECYIRWALYTIAIINGAKLSMISKCKLTFKSTKCATSRCNVDVIRNLLNQCVVIVVIELYITVSLRSKSHGGGSDAAPCNSI